MKILILSVFVVFGLAGVLKGFNTFNPTAIFNDLTSTTYIEPNQSFVLGEGKHDSYDVKVLNKGKVAVEVFGERENEERKSLGVLKPNDKNEYQIAKDTKAIFKNLGRETAKIGIKLSGNASLSMGYKPNNESRKSF